MTSPDNTVAASSGVSAAQALEALDQLEASALGDEPFNHFAVPLIRQFIEASITSAPPARAMQEQQAGVPAGHKLVPLEPTPEMIEAGRVYAECAIHGNAVLGYRAMLDAAPSAPPVAGDSVQQPAGEAPRPYGWAVHGQLYGDEAAAKDIARNVFGDESMATAVFTAAPIQQAAQPEAQQAAKPADESARAPERFKWDQDDDDSACGFMVGPVPDGQWVRWRDVQHLFASPPSGERPTAPAPAGAEAQQAAKPVAMVGGQQAREPEACPKCGCTTGVAHAPYFAATGWEVHAIYACDRCDHEQTLSFQISSPTAPAPAGAKAQQDAHATLLAVVRELVESHTAVYPPAEAGGAAQTAWVERRSAAIEAGQALLSGAPALAAKPFTITLRQAQKLLAFFGGHDCEVTVAGPLPDHPPGLYAWCTEYPEEGAEYLGPTEVDDELAANGIPAVAAEPLTEEQRTDLRLGACVFRVPPYDKNPQSQRIADLMEKLGRSAHGIGSPSANAGEVDRG